MIKEHDVSQGSDDSPAAFLEGLMETFHQYTPCNLSGKEHKATVTMDFIDQASRDIRKKLQRLERPDKPLRDLVQFAETGRQRRRGNRGKERKKRRERNLQSPVCSS